MKQIFTMALLFVATASFSQQDASHWKRKGNLNLLFNQSAFNKKWLGGGVSNIAGTLNFTYEFNYAKNNWTWDNRLAAAYGLTKIEDQSATKSEDRVEFQSVIGKKSGKNWFYSGVLNFKSQMARGEDNEGNYISHALSPAYLQTGLGMLYKPSENFKINIAPVTSKLILVDKQFTNEGSSFGVGEGKTSRFELGTSINLYAKYEGLSNISFENLLNLYSNYLEDAQNVDIDYTLNVVLTINNYLSTNISFQAIYDDNAIGDVQVREVFGLGVNYDF